MPRFLLRRWRAPAAIAVLLGSFGTALVIPIPAVTDIGRAAVHAEVRERLPGWTIQRLEPSWEGAYTVVTSCAGRRVGFQFVPGHGLRGRDAWLHPSNGYARTLLSSVSDHRRYLLWRTDPAEPEALSCDAELARSGDFSVGDRILD